MNIFNKSTVVMTLINRTAIGGLLLLASGMGCAQPSALSADADQVAIKPHAEISDGLIIKSPQDFQLPTDKRIESQKLPLNFKVTYGEDQPVCQAYSSMLNAAKYMGYPACQRKTWPEFKGFKYPDWEEVTDKTEAKKILEERISLIFASKNKLNSRDYVIKINMVKKNIDSGNDKLYEFSVDLNGDGKLEKIYKHTWIFPEAENFARCKVNSSFYVDDSTISLDSPKKYKKSGYDSLVGLGRGALLIKDEKIYHEIWDGPAFENLIYLHSMDRKKICSFGLQ